MAKIKDLKFEIKGQPYTVHVNCTSSGEFTANIPTFVADALHLNNRLAKPNLRELEKTFFDAINQYKKAETTQELFLAIKYGACGRYNRRSDNDYPLFGNGTKYEIRISFSEIDCLGFEFEVCIKETIDGKVNWFEAKLGKDFSHIQKEHSELEKYHKSGSLYHLDKWKMIPFSDKALETLTNGQEKIRQMSEMLFNFIEQDEKVIEQRLTNTKLLS